ncbi:MAG: DUF177 domain-containing protein [Acidimicrobiales bacterium]
MARSVLRIGVMELRRRPGTQREVHVAAPLDGLAITSAQVPDGAEVQVDGILEAIEGAMTITGTVTAPWTGECRRCLDPVHGELQATLSEVFEPHPTDGDTYTLVGDEVDLEPVARDAVLLHLPLAPLCREDCQGPAPEDFPAVVPHDDSVDDDAPPTDPRWAGLEQLKFD